MTGPTREPNHLSALPDCDRSRSGRHVEKCFGTRAYVTSVISCSSRMRELCLSVFIRGWNSSDTNAIPGCSLRNQVRSRY